MNAKWLLLAAVSTFSNILIQCATYLSNPELGSISAMMGWSCALLWIGVVEERMEQYE